MSMATTLNPLLTRRFNVCAYRKPSAVKPCTTTIGTPRPQTASPTRCPFDNVKAWRASRGPVTRRPASDPCTVAVAATPLTGPEAVSTRRPCSSRLGVGRWIRLHVWTRIYRSRADRPVKRKTSAPTGPPHPPAEKPYTDHPFPGAGAWIVAMQEITWMDEVPESERWVFNDVRVSRSTACRTSRRWSIARDRPALHQEATGAGRGDSRSLS